MKSLIVHFGLTSSFIQTMNSISVLKPIYFYTRTLYVILCTMLALALSQSLLHSLTQLPECCGLPKTSVSRDLVCKLQHYCLKSAKSGNNPSASRHIHLLLAFFFCLLNYSFSCYCQI